MACKLRSVRTEEEEGWKQRRKQTELEAISKSNTDGHTKPKLGVNKWSWSRKSATYKCRSPTGALKLDPRRRREVRQSYSVAAALKVTVGWGRCAELC